MSKKKLLSIELLRIISMLMVVAYHWQLHANDDSIYKSQLSGHQILSFAIGSWGTLGVNIFFIISAYFLIHHNQVKNNKLITMILKVMVYGTSIVLLAYAFHVVPSEIITLLKSVLGVFAYQYWFFTVYVVVYALHPALNNIIDSASFKYLIFMISVLIISTYFTAFAFGNEFLGRLACGITIYFTVGVLEKYPKMNLIERYRKVGIYITIIGCLILEVILSYLGNNYNELFFSCIRKIQDTHSPIMYIIGLFVFYTFKNMNIKQNVIIEFLGKYAVGAYLIHGGASFIKNYLWDGLFKAGNYYSKSLVVYAVHYIGSVLLLFILGVFIEFIYCNLIEKNIIKICDRFKWSDTINFDA